MESILAADLTPLAGAAVALDLDGTLVDTAGDLTATLNHVLGEEGLAPLPLEAARSMIGQGARALLARGFAAAGAPLAPDRLEPLFARFIAHYRAHIADQSRPFPGVTDALDRFTEAGLKLVVCTNKRTDLSTDLLRAVGLLERFDAVVGPDLAGAAKPDPRHLIAAVEAGGGRADFAVMVGDSVSDAAAARAAAIPLVLVSFGYTDTPARDLDPDVLIDHFDDLDAACARLLTRTANLSGDLSGAGRAGMTRSLPDA